MAFEPQANTPNEKMPNHVDETGSKSRNHIPLDMLGIPKPILGTNDEVKSIKRRHVIFGHDNF